MHPTPRPVMAAIAVAAVAMMASAPVVAAAHTGHLLFEETYAYTGLEWSAAFFKVPFTNDTAKVVCYLRSSVRSADGVWSATVHDRYNVPVVQDTAVMDPTGDQWAVALPTGVSPMGFTGDNWHIQVKAHGASSGTTVSIRYVETADQCTADHW